MPEIPRNQNIQLCNERRCDVAGILGLRCRYDTFTDKCIGKLLGAAVQLHDRRVDFSDKLDKLFTQGTLRLVQLFQHHWRYKRLYPPGSATSEELERMQAIVGGIVGKDETPYARFNINP